MHKKTVQNEGICVYIRLNIVYLLLPEINTDRDDIEGAVNIAREMGADCIRFSAPLPNFEGHPSASIPPSYLDDAFKIIKQLQKELDAELRLELQKDPAARRRVPKIFLRLYPEWSLDGFTKCRSQLFTPALGVDGHFYPCCQVAYKKFSHLRVTEATEDQKENNWVNWYDAANRRSLIERPVGERLGKSPGSMNCRVCNRKDGTINALMRAFLMSRE